MMLDANTAAKMIRITIARLKADHGATAFEKGPWRSIIIALEELADSFDGITDRARSERVDNRSA